MRINKITDASIHFGKALFVATFDLTSVLNSFYQTTNSENNNTDENNVRTMQVPKSENTTSRERGTPSPLFDNNRMQTLINENKSGYPNLNDGNRNDHNVPTSPV